jgi:hypothetical protein
MDLKCKICNIYSTINANQRFRPRIVSEHRVIRDVCNLTTGCFMNFAINLILQMKFSLEMSPVLKYKFVKGEHNVHLFVFRRSLIIDILYTLDSASLLVKLKSRIFQRLPPFE